MSNQVDSRPIIAVGDLVWDVLAQPDTMLLPGGDTTGRIALSPGGSAANFAVWAARAGAAAGFVGCLGADFFGDAIARDLEAQGVRSWLTRVPGRDTGVVLVLIDKAGQRSMVTNQGADFALLPEHLPTDALRGARHVHLTAPRRAALEAARVAKAGGASVSLDPASFQMIRELGREEFLRLLAGMPVDILLPNQDEGMALTGKRERAAVAEALQQLFPGAVVALKLDDEGCYVLHNGASQHFPAVPVTARDATGAGDAFDAAFVSHYIAMGDIGAAARFANALGAWVVARFGARPPEDAELRAILSAT
jgi:sugar/nucleoside kinase (ribokinase family)